MKALLLVILCAAAALVVGGLTVFSLRRKLRRGPYIALWILLAVLVMGAVLLPVGMAMGHWHRHHDWQVIHEQQATAAELKLLRRSFPGVVAQTDRRIYLNNGSFMLAITRFETEAQAQAFWNFRYRQTMNLHLYNGTTHIELYSRDANLRALLWATFKPDPAIRRYASLVQNGVLFWRIAQDSEPVSDNIEILYHSLSSYGQINLALLKNPAEIPEGWQAVPENPGLAMEYLPMATAGSFQEKLMDMLQKPLPERFCPPEIFAL